MADQKVDPGALLMAVLTVAAVPLTEEGPWELMNTVVALVVGVLICCYLLPDAGSTRRHRLAFSVVAGLTTAIFCAWPVQWLIWRSATDREADYASRIALAIGVVATGVVWAFVRRRKQPVEVSAA
ncbi:hypothetical protein [Kribbella sp. NPDC051770]|uniref:hypothetical protein n=1 Tax=Kribbella sp. NPDC051770 TaxID=3155413 RepID=UPI0034314C9D